MKAKLFLLLSLLVAFSCTKSETPNTISVSGPLEYKLGNKANVLTIKVVCDASWSYDLGGADWITEQGVSGSSAQFRVSANDLESERSARIVFFTPANGEGKRSEASVSVTQAAKDIVPQLTVDPYGSVQVPSSGQSLTVKVSTNLKSWEYEIQQAPDWVTAQKSADGLNLTVGNNPLEDSRSVTVMFYAPDKASYQALAKLTVNQDANVIEYDPVYLSKDGTSNCYLITHRGEYSFDATVRGNGKAVKGLDAPAPIKASKARLIWQSAPGMIKEVSFKDGVVTFFANRVFGNALIGVTDDALNILWSWHIWFPSEEVGSLRSSSGDDVMSFNLGALSSKAGDVESYGLLYQWGRKDPFPGSPIASGGDLTLKGAEVYDIDGKVVAIGNSTSSKTIEYSIANPTICIGNRDQYISGCRDWITAGNGCDALWGNPAGYEKNEGDYINTGSKTFYDPCPLGWRVPPASAFAAITKTGGISWAIGDTEAGLTWCDLGGETEVNVADYNKDGKFTLADWTNGWHLILNKVSDAVSYFPAATRYDGQYALLMGSMVGLWGNYWYNTVSEEEGGLAMAMTFSLKEYGSPDYSIIISPLSSGSRADALSVRCIKE